MLEPLDHNALISGHNGSSIAEVNLHVLVMPMCLLLRGLLITHACIYFKWTKSEITKLVSLSVLELVILVCPSVACVTILSEHLGKVVVFFGLMNVILMVVNFRQLKPDAFNSIKTTSLDYVFGHQPASLYSQELSFVTWTRAQLFLLTALCILSVDFRAFPRRLAKTEVTGYSLMDVGVGAFVLAGAITSKQSKTGLRLHAQTLEKSIKSTLPLICLGFLRLALVKVVGYHEHESEYGRHWNFFFTLAVIKLFSSLIPMSRSRLFSTLFPVVIIVCYQFALQRLGLAEVLEYGLSGSGFRNESVFDANREGILSLGGYIALYYFGVNIGLLIFAHNGRYSVYALTRLIIYTSIISFVCYLGATLCHNYVAPTSRKQANLPYVLFVIHVFCLLLSVNIFSEIVLAVAGSLCAAHMVHLSPGSKPASPNLKLWKVLNLKPLVFSAVNYNALFFFLLANILTGLVNISSDTTSLPDSVAVLVVLSYMSVLCSISVMLYIRGMRCPF